MCLINNKFSYRFMVLICFWSRNLRSSGGRSKRAGLCQHVCNDIPMKGTRSFSCPMKIWTLSCHNKLYLIVDNVTWKYHSNYISTQKIMKKYEEKKYLIQETWWKNYYWVIILFNINPILLLTLNLLYFTINVYNACVVSAQYTLFSKNMFWYGV